MGLGTLYLDASWNVTFSPVVFSCLLSIVRAKPKTLQRLTDPALEGVWSLDPMGTKQSHGCSVRCYPVPDMNKTSCQVAALLPEVVCFLLDHSMNLYLEVAPLTMPQQLDD